MFFLLFKLKKIDYTGRKPLLQESGIASLELINVSIEVGSIHEGKVTGIMSFGAFVQLPEGKSGLVHISEIANTFVRDVHEHLQVGQQVRVKVIGINEQGKINLSIKKALEEGEPQQKRPVSGMAPFPRQISPDRRPQPEEGELAPPSQDQSFEDKLKKFMQASDSKNADKRRNTERKQHARRK